jgi:hypothetical protein
MIRNVTKEDIEAILHSAEDMAELAVLHAQECNKDYQQLAMDEDLYEDRMERSEDYWQRDQPSQDDDVLGQGSPGRIFNNALTNPEEGLKMKK